MIEAKLDRGRGPVATVLVQRGTLRVGDIIVAGAEMGRVRALISDQGDTVQEAGPSVPVEVLGFNGPPEAGDRLAVVENEARARESHRLPRPSEAREGGRPVDRHARLARADDEPAQDHRPQGLPADHQGRRAGLARSDPRLAGEARHRRGRRAHPARRRRRHLARATSRWPKASAPSSSASRSAPTRRPPRPPSATASRSATTTSSTISWTT